MSSRIRSLQDLALRLAGIIPGKYRAVCLTTLYELHRVLGGHAEPWIEDEARNPKGASTALKIFPMSWRRRLYGVAYVAQLHMKGHVLPGVWKMLGNAPRGHEKVAGLPKKAFPNWMLEDLRALSQSEAAIFPNEDFFSHFYAWRPHADVRLGQFLALQWGGVSHRKFDVVVLSPWIKTGGADKGVLQYLEFYRQRFDSVLLLTTYPSPSTRLDRVPPGVIVRELGESWGRLSKTEQSVLLARFLLLLRPRIVHNVLSEMAWLTYVNHGKALRATGIKLMASLFTEEVAQDGRRGGYAVDYLPHCRDVLDALITDNRRWAEEFSRRYALHRIDVRAVHFHFEQVELESKNKSVAQSEDRPSFRHVLWAGRLSREKRPDLLLEIVRRLPDTTFHVWGQTDSNSALWVRKLRVEKNVRMHGAYAKFSDISNLVPYAAFLYTTAYDGMPNVVLEAAAAELPIIAPIHVGGLSDLLDEATAFCVEDENDVSSYVNGLKRALEKPQLGIEKARLARARLIAEFSKEVFVQSMTMMSENILGNSEVAPVETEIRNKLSIISIT